MHTNYFLNFKMALYSSALVMKVEIINVKLKDSLLLNALLHIHPLTITTEAIIL